MHKLYDLEQLQIFLSELGDKLLDMQKKNLPINYKKDGSKVSDADLFSDQKIYQFLTKNYCYKIISEERENFLLKDELTWVVDPIDGSNHFLKKSRDFAIMLALMQNKKCRLGIVYLPATKQGYFAQNGQGSYYYQMDKNHLIVSSQKIFVDKKSELSKRIFLTSNPKKDKQEVAWFKKKSLLNYKIMGSLGIKMCLIAEGKAHYYLNIKGAIKIWDILAPALIVEEACGVTGDSEGNHLCYSDGFQIPNGLWVASDKLITPKLTKESFDILK
jgi:3'(2'), 5'-bisphosphate nucleotidase